MKAAVHTPPTCEPKSSRLPMWCDDFDMDLLKVLPEVERLLAPLSDIRLYTTCRPTFGRINLPCSWDDYAGITCFVGFLREREELPAVGPQPLGYYTDSPVVEATAEEMFRDLWVHQCRWVQVQGPGFCGRWDHKTEAWRPHALTRNFMDLMYHLRRIWPMEEGEWRYARRKALQSIADASRRLERLHRLFLAGPEATASNSVRLTRRQRGLITYHYAEPALSAPTSDNCDPFNDN
jgi:hypothetical protein